LSASIIGKVGGHHRRALSASIIGGVVGRRPGNLAGLRRELRQL